jgi:ElaB/YqjD/DUF883 family membrane-anchored ribosome-binding protein
MSSKKKITSFDQAQNELERNSVPAEQMPATLKGALKLMKPQIQSKWNELKETSSEQLNAAKIKVVDASKQAVDKVDTEARKRPWHFMGVASFFSLVFGFLMGRKSKKNR